MLSCNDSSALLPLRIGVWSRTLSFKAIENKTKRSIKGLRRRCPYLFCDQIRYSIVKAYFLLLFLLGSILSSAQNLLVNGGFEDENICTEYHEPCAPEGWPGNTGRFKNYFVDSD